MFNDFISTNWKTHAINKTNEKINQLNEEYKNLGKDDITINELYNFIKSKIDFSNLIVNCKFKFNKFENDKGVDLGNYLNYNKEIKKIPKIYENYKDMIISKLMNNIDDIFKIDNEYKICRFEYFHNYLKEEYTKIIKNHYNHIDIWFNKYISKFKYELTEEELNKLELYIYINFRRYIEYDLINFNIDNNNNKSLLTENKEWINKRKSLYNSITNYKKHKCFFENL